ncbi:MAG: DNA mismatch repair protein MutS [SAR202 cluster bacterium]|nr:MAG: DNA mismatch repair protein MutS [SAR202 cluster bacterium]MQG75495.1 DNA mismatch repair protein MutS [SAR202 cluster bacterium]
MTTPARKQYLKIKSDHKDEILLFRMGDFYETFDEDARIISRELEIALTSREMGKGHKVPLAGIPYHALESYLTRLINRGFRVAICEQTSDPASSKGIVDREVVRIVTPGTVVEDSLLQQRANSFLMSIVMRGDEAGISVVDITTSDFLTTQLKSDRIESEITRLSPKEILLGSEWSDRITHSSNSVTTLVDISNFDPSNSVTKIKKFFGVDTLEPFGCDHLPLATQASAAIIEYLEIHQKEALLGMTNLQTYSVDEYMVLDRQTRRNLELFLAGRWDASESSLFSVLDRTSTPMGGRLLQAWIGKPLLNVEEITIRQEAISWFFDSETRRRSVIQLLKNISDLERLSTKVATRRATPRDLIGIVNSVSAIPKLLELLNRGNDSKKIEFVRNIFGNHSDLISLLSNALTDDPPITTGDGNSIRSGYSNKLDQLKDELTKNQKLMATLESDERDQTGIKTLKIGFNRVFGYYIEVSRSNLNSVPEHYIRKQTLVGGERYITPQMKELEAQILTGRNQISIMESEVFSDICDIVALEVATLKKSAEGLAIVDVLNSLAVIAQDQKYARPKLNHSGRIQIVEGRHPVVENITPQGMFISNDTDLNLEESQIIILTGPNMSGKSTYLRQVGLITLMAQIGSYVPAKSAEIGVVDRIFTRVGLQDDLTAGQSTFMVEMVETASILNQATRNSLIILDEIGRGTSTYDGLAIARSVAEYVHNNFNLGCKMLFATHYHEMTSLSNELPRAKNYHVSVTEDKGDVVFLRRIVEGGADRSYGVHVARLAGIPSVVINRAWEILRELEEDQGSVKLSASGDSIEGVQLSFLNRPTHLAEEIKEIEISDMTPLEAITKLYELQTKADQNY